MATGASSAKFAGIGPRRWNFGNPAAARQRAIVMPSEIDGATLARLVAAVEAAP